MANVVLLSRHIFDRSSPVVDKPEVETVSDVCDRVGLFRGALLDSGGVMSPPVPSRVTVARCRAEVGTGNSRATGSSCRKHFRSSSCVDPMSVDELASLMDPGAAGRPFVVLDCRAFLSFNVNHVAGAFNAACADKFSRRRLTQGRATVADLISGGPSKDGGCVREVYSRLAGAAVASSEGLFVAYDDNTTKLDSLQESHPLRLLTTALTGSGCRTKYLEGNLSAML